MFSHIFELPLPVLQANRGACRFGWYKDPRRPHSYSPTITYHQPFTVRSISHLTYYRPLANEPKIGVLVSGLHGI